MQFPRKLTASETRSGREFEFSTSEDLLAWARAESDFWKVEGRAEYQALDQIWGAQTAFFNSLISLAETFESNGAEATFAKLHNRLRESLDNGTALTSSHPSASSIVEMARSNLSAGALLLMGNLPFTKRQELLNAHSVPLAAALVGAFATLQASERHQSLTTDTKKEINTGRSQESSATRFEFC